MYLYDKVISNLQSYLTTTKSLHAMPASRNSTTAAQIAELLKKQPPQIRKVSAA